MGKFDFLLLRKLPKLTTEIRDYVNGVLANNMDEFSTPNDIFVAIGDLFQSVAIDKSPSYVQGICVDLFNIIKGMREEEECKLLKSPISLKEMAIKMEAIDQEMKNIWLENKKIPRNVIKKPETKLQNEIEKESVVTSVELEAASVAQTFDKKITKMEEKGINRSMNIKIEDFDLSFGDNVLLQNANLLLAYGRRYGLVGRNGLGKTTLLRSISGRQLVIPAYISILHVEQEVTADNTTVIDSVLECDVERARLLKREKELVAAMNVNQNLITELNIVYEELQAIEADKAPSRASVILRGLGFDNAAQLKPTKVFSGGWRMRIALARALFFKPDVLLLDEPTNMLDFKAIMWLGDYLQNWPSILLVVSHDRNFLNIVPTDIIHWHAQTLDRYKGNYEHFERMRNEKLKAQRREYLAQMIVRTHAEEFINSAQGGGKTASSAKSRKKMLEKLPILSNVEEESKVKLDFPEVEYLKTTALTISNMAFKYENADLPVFKNVYLLANFNSRVCIVGENGIGKSTLLKIIVGKLQVTHGDIKLHRNVRIGYLAQHHVDNLNFNRTCIDILADVRPGLTEGKYRSCLSKFGISGHLPLQHVASLSGGQKSRVAFAKMFMEKPNFLVLDEPTNHLDMETIEALACAIINFKGGAILVSHNERFIEMTCKELWICGNGTVKESALDAYKRQLYAEIEQNDKS